MEKKEQKRVAGYKSENQKLKTYLIYQILQRETDENHIMKAKDLAAALNDMGIDAERRSVYRDIDAINEACWLMEQRRNGEEATIQEAIEAIVGTEGEEYTEEEQEEREENKTIACVKRGKDSGFYVKERRHSFEQIRLLAETVYTAKFLSPKESKDLADVLCDFVSDHQAEAIRHDVFVTDRIKTNNKNVLNFITTIDGAMATKVEGEKHEPEKISFQYLSYSVSDLKQVKRRKGEQYIVSPYKILAADGNYYLLAFDDRSQKMRTFRIDRMKGVSYAGAPRDGGEEFAAIDLKNYTRERFGMFDGRRAYVSIRCINPLLDTMVERFGTENSTRYAKDGEEHFIVSTWVRVSDQFFGWLLGFGRRVKLIDDEETVKGFAVYLDKVKEMY